MPMTIRGGEQYLIPVVLMNGTEVIKDTDVDMCMIQLNDFMAEYPEGDLIYSERDNAWLFPMKESMSSNLANTVRMQAKFMIGGSIFASAPKRIDFERGIMKSRWFE